MAALILVDPEPEEETLPTMGIPNCARPLYRMEDHWPYGCPRRFLMPGKGAFVPNSVLLDPRGRFTPHLRVAKTRGFSLNGWGLITTAPIPKRKKK